MTGMDEKGKTEVGRQADRNNNGFVGWKGEPEMKTCGKQYGYSSYIPLMALLAVALAACGGGGGGGGTVGSSSPAISAGTMTKGSAIVNGIRFAVSPTTVIRKDDTTGHAEAELRDGMEVKVKGEINDDRLTGQAEKIEVEHEVRGALSGKGADDFTVRGQHVITDDRTVFEDRLSATSFNPLTFADLADGEKVEVHGGRDDLGDIHATRVERRNDNPDDDVRGVVTAKVGTVISIGAFSIDIAGVPTSPPGQTVNVGDLVEVHLDAAGAATRVDLEELEDQAEEMEPAEGEEFEVEGFVSGFTAHPGTFKVGNDNVQTTSSTRFEGGVAADLMDGIKVEAEGHMTGGTLVADKIKFKDSIRIEANADSDGSANALGKTVRTNSGTKLVNLPGGTAGILAGDGLKIRGFPNSDNTITATRIQKLNNPVQANQMILQGPVSSFSGPPASTMLIVGITVNASGAGEFQALDDSLLSAAAFFNSLTAGRTIVKARGSFAGSTLTADKVEIEEP
jgi:hypothetical protein